MQVDARELEPLVQRSVCRDRPIGLHTNAFPALPGVRVERPRIMTAE